MSKQREQAEISGTDMFPDGGTWYVYSKPCQRPAIMTVDFEGDPYAKENTGVLCFRTEALAKRYLEIIRSHGSDTRRQQVRYVRPEELHAWLVQCQDHADNLLWVHLGHQPKHQAVAIAELLQPEAWELVAA